MHDFEWHFSRWPDSVYCGAITFISTLKRAGKKIIEGPVLNIPRCVYNNGGC